MTSRREKEKLQQLSETLFGPPEDLSLDDVVEILKTADIDPRALRDRTYQRLLLEARAYRSRQQEVPALLRKALEDLRPESAAPRSQGELDRAASATLSRVFDAVRIRFQPQMPELATAYRNKKPDESAKDQKIISELEQELMRDLLGEDETD